MHTNQQELKGEKENHAEIAFGSGVIHCIDPVSPVLTMLALYV